jgi:hypothetical protein
VTRASAKVTERASKTVQSFPHLGTQKAGQRSAVVNLVVIINGWRQRQRQGWNVKGGIGLLFHDLISKVPFPQLTVTGW